MTAKNNCNFTLSLNDRMDSHLDRLEHQRNKNIQKREQEKSLSPDILAIIEEMKSGKSTSSPEPEKAGLSEEDERLLKVNPKKLCAAQVLRRQQLKKLKYLIDPNKVIMVGNRTTVVGSSDHNKYQKTKSKRIKAIQARERLPRSVRTIPEMYKDTIVLVMDALQHVVKYVRRHVISIAEIMARTKVSRSSVIRAITDLEAYKLISIKREKKPDGENEINRYFLSGLFFEKGSVNDDTLKEDNKLSSKDTFPTSSNNEKGTDAHRSHSASASASFSEERKCISSSEKKRKYSPRKDLFDGGTVEKEMLRLAWEAFRILLPSETEWHSQPDSMDHFHYLYDDKIKKGFLPKLKPHLWELTERARGRKLRTLILLEAAVLKKIGHIERSAEGYFCGIAKKSPQNINVHDTLGRVLAKRNIPVGLRLTGGR